jgi:hypothetical protein
MLMQDLLRFTDHRGRDAGLIVNALLQHDGFGKPWRSSESYWPLKTTPTFSGAIPR